jgi:hypothetical protein
MQIHPEFREIPGSFTAKNTAEFLMFFKKFRIPSEVKNALPWTPIQSSLPGIIHKGNGRDLFKKFIFSFH